jgi:hypothetical protein
MSYLSCKFEQSENAIKSGTCTVNCLAIKELYGMPTDIRCANVGSATEPAVAPALCTPVVNKVTRRRGYTTVDLVSPDVHDDICWLSKSLYPCS